MTHTETGSTDATDALPSDETLRWFWQEMGGGFLGTMPQHGSMPSEKLLPFLRKVLNRDVDVLKILRKAPR